MKLREELYLVFAAIADLDKRVRFLTRRSTETMATLQDLQDKIDAERVQVGEGFAALKGEIQALQDQIAGGVVVSSEQLDALMAAVDNIYSPEVVEPTPVEPEPVVEEPVVDDMPVELPSDVEQPVA